MNKTRETFGEILIILSSALVGLSFQENKILAIFFLIALIFGLYLKVFYNKINTCLASLRRRTDKSIVVGILNEIDWSEFSKFGRSWSPYSYEDWKEGFERRNTIVKPINKITAFRLNRCDIVLNPYSGVYPESDAESLESLHLFFDYVSRGGVFVNVGDIPGYYEYSKPLYKPYNSVLMQNGRYEVNHAPFVNNLKIRVHLVGENDQFIVPRDSNDYEVERYIVVKEGKEQQDCISENYIPWGEGCYERKKYDLGVKEFPEGEYSSCFRKKYGEGSFIISLMHMGKAEQKDDEDAKDKHPNKSVKNILIINAIRSVISKEKNFFGSIYRYIKGKISIIFKHIGIVSFFGKMAFLVVITWLIIVTFVLFYFRFYQCPYQKNGKENNYYIDSVTIKIR
ncbi:hypothetical protein KKH43_04015 [Patescibacteria group bacterium]|nr:hypothetical protein [Patescibacteria group bacterium]